MLNIRTCGKTDAEYEAIVAIHNAVMPRNTVTVKEWKHWDKARNPDFMYHREVVELDGKIVAVGFYRQFQWSYHPDKYGWETVVYPEYEGRGIRKAHYEHVMKILAERNPLAITSELLADMSPALQFLEENGFREIMRYEMSQLEIDTFDASGFTGLPGKMREAGIRITTVKELAETDPDWKHKIYELDWELEQDVPSAEPPVKSTFEQFNKSAVENPNFLPEGWFVALDGDQYVGESSLWLSQSNKEKLETGLTGVVRSHRRKGIATALKVRAIDFARQRGVKFIETDNEENNPMYQINVMLGFKALPPAIEFEKQLREETAKDDDKAKEEIPA